MAKTALITGGGSGIGRAVALTLQSHGYRVAVCGRREDKLSETVAAADPAAEPMLAIPADVTDPASVEALFARLQHHFARLDLLFNNAGTGAPAIPFEDLTLEQWNRVVAVNLTAVFLCSQQAIRWMKWQSPQGGRIINNGSISAHVPRPHSLPYTATKHAITGVTRSIALDGRPFHITCGQIDIGNAVTPLTERMAEGVLQPDGSLRAEPRMDVQHVGDAVLYMASLPLDVNVPFLTVMAAGMPYIGRG